MYRSCWTDAAAFGAIILLGAVLYGHTLQAPWYFDDLHAIVENPSIRDFAGASGRLFNPRGTADWTFALNYRLGGLALPSFHLVNIVIHLFTSSLVFLILKRVFRSSIVLPLLAALIFLAHPLQTQAVTYIVQRYTCLSALFFFLAVYLYLRAREESPPGQGLLPAPKGLLWLFFAVLAGAVAVFTKQNAAVLPVALLLFDRFFLPRDLGWKRRLLFCAPFFIAPCWLFLQQIVLPTAGGESLAALGHAQSLSNTKTVTPLRYFVTEFSVLWLYLRLLVFPVGQALDYSFPIVNEIFTWKNGAALAGLVGLLLAAVACRRKFPLISFGVLWFFLTLTVESTFIPLDPVFEHRLYVPIFGFCLVLVGTLLSMNRKIAGAVLLLLVGCFSILTWSRNSLWNDPVAFNLSNLAIAPHSERVRLALANTFMDRGEFAQAEILLLEAVEVNEKYDQPYASLALSYIHKGELEKAHSFINKGLARNPSNKKLLNNLGVLHNMRGEFESARQFLRMAIFLDGNFSDAYTNMGVSYAGEELWPEAADYYRLGIKSLPDNSVAHYNLGVALYHLGQLGEALRAFQTATVLAPDDPQAIFNSGIVAQELGDFAAASAMLPGLRKIAPALAAKLAAALASSGSN